MGADRLDTLSAPDRISAADALMWRIEADPVLRSPILVVGLLDRAPDQRAVRAAVERWVELFPRFRQRAAIAPAVAGGSRWVDDEHFSLDHHVRRTRAPGAGGVAALLAAAAPTATDPFDPARAPWELTVVDRIDAGRGRSRAGFVLRFHHTISDGVGAVDLATRLFDGVEPSRARAAPPAPRPGGALGTALRGVASAGSTATTVLRDPVGAARRGARLSRSVARALAPVPAALSPVFTRRGLDRWLDVIERPMDDLHSTARALGCTVNDLFLAVVGGALHRYHRELGHEVPALRFTMPISLRDPDDPAGGNRFAPARFVLPIDDPDPAVRAQIAHAIARRWRDEPALARTGDLAALLDLLPGPVVTRVFADMLEKIDVDAVDVPGLAEVPIFAGARLERLWAFAPPTGAALSVTLLSHAGTACIAVNADVAAVPEAVRVRGCLEAALDEVLPPRSQESTA